MVSFDVLDFLLFLVNNWFGWASPILGTLGHFKDNDVSVIVGVMVSQTGGADDDSMGTGKDVSKKCASNGR